MQTAAAASSGRDEFFDRLRGAGVLVRERHSDRTPGEVTGYSVAVPGFRNRAGQPVWYGGGKLAADLSLPKLEAHWRCTRPGRHPDASARVRLRHEIERAASRTSDPTHFFTELRQAGVLVKERYSQHNPAEITGYAVALPNHHPDVEPVWHSGGKLAAELSLPRLQARWTGQEPAPAAGRTTRLSAEERQAVWEEATQAATAAAAEIRHLSATDPAAAGDTARAAADLLHAAARVAEPSGQGPLSGAAAAYDRASRDLYGRTPAGGPSAAAELRLSALALTLLRRAAPSDTAAVATLIVAVAGLAEAVGELRAAQQRHHQAAAAYEAAEPLRAFTVASPPPATHDATRARTSSVRAGPEPPSRGRER